MTERDPPLTQQALADRVGVSQAAVTGWLHGTIPYPRTLNELCLTLGVRRDWLLRGKGEKYLPAGLVAEMPPTYSRREKISVIEEQAPELLPLVDAFLDSMQKQIGDVSASTPKKKTREASH
jgi:transcriptional regulator with XRE-family HTH domain